MTVRLYCPENGPENGRGLIRDFRVLWVLEELGTRYEIEWFDLAEGGHKSESYLKLNPFGRIPTVLIDENPLFESAAIVITLADRAGKLTFSPDTPERTAMYKWAFTALATADLLFFDLFAAHFLWPEAPGSAEKREKSRASANEFLGAVEWSLGDRTYLIGNDFSIADLLLSAVLRYTVHLDMLADFPRLKTYLEGNYARPAFARAYDIHLQGPENDAAASEAVA